MPFIVTKQFAVSMIIGTEFLDRHVGAIHCMEGIVETIRGTVRILGRYQTTVEAAEANSSTPKQPIGKPTEPDKADLTRSAIRAAQKITFPR